MRNKYFFIFFCFFSLIPTISCRKASAGSRAQGRKRKQRGVGERLGLPCQFRREYTSQLKTQEAPLRAFASLRGRVYKREIRGWASFHQFSSRSAVLVNVEVNGLLPNFEHGFFLNTYGRPGFRCTRTGGHYNPWNQSHSSSATSCFKHVGDYHSLVTNGSGFAQQWFYETATRLQGPHSVIGRSLVILLLDSDNANETGFRLACGVISLASNTSYRIVDYDPEMPDLYSLRVKLGFASVMSAFLLYRLFAGERRRREAKRLRYARMSPSFGEAKKDLRSVRWADPQHRRDYTFGLSSIIRGNKLYWYHRLAYDKRHAFEKDKRKEEAVNLMRARVLHSRKS